MYYENLTHMDSVSNVFFIELNLPFFISQILWIIIFSIISYLIAMSKILQMIIEMYNMLKTCLFILPEYFNTLIVV